VCQLALVSFILLSLAHDVETNPGPHSHTEDWNCGVCDRECGWDTKAVACDECNQWYHIDCQGISSRLYGEMDNSFAWTCLQCGLPNFSTAFFDITAYGSNNPFDILSDTSQDSLSPGAPQASSTPTHQRTRNRQLHQHVKAPLRVLVVNCESLQSQAKQSLFASMIESTKPHIIHGTESWLKEDITSSEVFPSNYTIIRKDRDKIVNKEVFGPMRDSSSHGGVFIAVSNDLVCSEAPELDVDAEIVWATITMHGGKKVYFGSFYRQPRTNLEYLQLLDNSLSRLDDKNASIILGGDFNLPDFDWTTGVVHENARQQRLHHLFQDIMAEHGLEQLVEKPTFERNTLDLLLTNNPASVNRIEVIPGICRHGAILSEFALQPTKAKVKPRKVLIHRRADMPSLKNDMEEFISAFINKDTSNISCNQLWEDFKVNFNGIINNNVPSKMLRPNSNLPWITSKERRLINRRRRLYNRSKTPEARSKYRQFAKDVDKQIKRAYFTYLEEILKPDESQTGWNKNKRWFSFLKAKKREQSSGSPLKEGGKLVTDDAGKAGVLNRQFYAAYTRDDGSPLPDLGPSTHPTMRDIEFSTPGIEKLLQGLKPHKAAGPDDIAARYLKETASIIAPALQRIFTTSYLTGDTPNDWKMANICPVFKKGERYQAANYRPVSLTCISAKIMEHCIVSNMLDHMEENKIFYPLQHGFRRQLSTETQLITFVQQLATELKNGHQVDSVILDFSKAFDKVCHRLLLHKLQFYGINGLTKQWISAFLTGRSQQVVVNGEKSAPMDVLSGVPQGTVIGPILFLCYINDMPSSVSSQVRLFADDAIIYRRINTEKDTELLQNDLNSLENWEKTWKMSFNASKCESIIFSRKRSTRVTTYFLHDTPLKLVTSAKYLGITLASNLSWSRHIDFTVKKANRAYGLIRRNLKVAPKEVRSHAYISLVRPHLEYGATIWDPHTAGDSNRIEAVQRRAARFCCGRWHNLSSPTQMVAELKWMELWRRRRLARLTLLYKLCHQLLNVNTSHLLVPTTRPTRHSHPLTFQKLHSTQNYYNLSFFPRTVNDWNNLPASLALAPSIEAFSVSLKAHAGSLN